MTNEEYLIKLLTEEDGAIMDYLTCKACIYRHKTCDAFRKTCDRGRSMWLKKEKDGENEGLKSCPFCGADVNMTYNSVENTFNIWHKGASCSIVEPIKIDGAGAKSIAEAMKKWNRRVEDGKVH